MIERTLILVKPDAVERGLVGEIINRFETVGLKIIGLKMVWVDKEFCRKHYAPHVDKPFYPGLEVFMTSGPVVAMVLEGIKAVAIARKFIGDTEPLRALPGTIRGDYAFHSYSYTDNKGIPIKNLVHASDSAENAKAEIELWFNNTELHKYSTVHDKHVL
ncbi:MAG: nucleoside-diphosphate kinase [archaeon]